MAFKDRAAWLCAAVAPVLAAGLWPAARGEEAIRHSEVRLLEGPRSAESSSAGIEIELHDGWKTYWRMPGESGVPPRFDWSGSSNLASVEIAWPAPSRFLDAGGETIGYKDRVVFPLMVRPDASGKPITLNLKLDYAVCKDICVPAQAQASRELKGRATVEEQALIKVFEAQVPQASAAGLRVERVRIAGSKDSPRLAIELDGKAVEDTDIFVEGFDDAYFRAPERRASEGPKTIFEVPIDGLKDPAVLSGRALTLTVVSRGFSLVREVRVE
jgi:DsbC/DsbD-like thiol-disulfide interchange protein